MIKAQSCIIFIIFSILSLIALLGFSPIGAAQVGTWTRKADMSMARDGMGASVVDGKIYAIGGYKSGAIPLSMVEEYDPITDTWTKKADMPTPRYQVNTEVVNGKIYAIGGWNIIKAPNPDATIYSTVEEYDPKTDTWTKKANMLTPRAEFCTGVVDGKIYAISGGNYDKGYWDYAPGVEEYNPATDTWAAKADIPTPRDWPSASVANGKIYVFGGWYNQDNESVVEEYDPATDTWTRKSDMPTPRGHLPPARWVAGSMSLVERGWGPETEAYQWWRYMILQLTHGQRALICLGQDGRSMPAQ